MTELLSGESGGQRSKLEHEAVHENGQDFEEESVVSKAADLLRHSAEDAHHALKHSPDLKVFGAQPSHGLMGSGGQAETRPPGRRIPRQLQRGELFQKIHSALFVILATVASTFDAGITWVRGMLAQLWGQAAPVSAHKERIEDMHPPTLPQDRDLAPAGSDAGGPAVRHPHTE